MFFRLMMVFAYVISLPAFSSEQASPLELSALSVPVEQLDERGRVLVAREIPGNPKILRSHYVIALFEDLKLGQSWYIVDAYYELSSGHIVFLDVQYYPSTRTWRDLGNYSPFVLGVNMRYLLQADSICDPYHRHFIGVLQGFADSGFDAIREAFQNRFGRKPNLRIDSHGNFFVSDPTANGMDIGAFFALSEADIIEHLRGIPGMPELRIVESGRAESDDEIRKTYLPIGNSCQ